MPPSRTSHIHVVILETKIKKIYTNIGMVEIKCEKPSSISLPLVSNAVMVCNFSIKSRTGCTRIDQLNNSSWWYVFGSNITGYGKLVHYLSVDL